MKIIAYAVSLICLLNCITGPAAKRSRYEEKDNLAKLNRFHLHLRDMFYTSGSDLCSKEENPDLP